MSWGRREFRRWNLPDDLLYDLAVAIIVLGLVGARLLYVALEWQTYHTNPIAIFMIWADGGLSFHGAVIGGVLATLWLTKRYRVSFWTVADASSPSIALGHIFGRIGCFLNGCCYGVPTKLPWGMRFFNPAIGVDTLPSHPTQLYEAVGLLLLFAWLAHASRITRYDGAVFIQWLIGYSVLRFFVEFFRAGATAKVIHDLTYAQWLSLALFAFAFSYHLWRMKKQQPSA